MRGVQSSADRVPRNLRHTAVDIETWGLDATEDGSSFALGGAYDERGETRFDSRDEMAGWIRSKGNRGRVFWAHNGGRFDYVSLFGNYVVRHPRDVIRVNGRLIELKIRSGKNVTRLRDSYNLYPRPLAALGDALGYPKGETPQKFIDADRSQGIEEKDFEYCLRDCRILYESVMALQTEFGEVRATLPSMALAVFKRRYLTKEKPYLVPTDQQPLDLGWRAAYYGGRVEAYYVGAVGGTPHYYDINSLYPKAMLLAQFPDPWAFHARPLCDFEWHLAHHAGYAYAKVTIPETIDPPPLPWRHPKTKKLLFPVGDLEGAWTFIELRHAIELGCAVTPISYVCAKPLEQSPFAAYVTDLYAKKQTATGVMREVYKLLLNGLYGKFGEFHRTQTEYSPTFDENRLAELQAEYPTAAFKAVSRQRADGYYEWPSEDGGEATHAIYSWAASVTAQARVMNLQIQELLKAHGIATLYTDTDSFLTSAAIITDRPALAELVGSDLGQLKQEDKVITEIWGAKAYLTDKDRTLRGVGKRAQPIAFWLDTKKPSLFGNWGITTTADAIRRGVKAGAPRYLVKTGVVSYDKRKIAADGTTRPWRVAGGELV